MRLVRYRFSTPLYARDTIPRVDINEKFRLAILAEMKVQDMTIPELAKASHYGKTFVYSVLSERPKTSPAGRGIKTTLAVWDRLANALGLEIIMVECDEREDED
jgi:hypothetical protein